MGEKFSVLYGFSNIETQDLIETALIGYGCDVTSNSRFTKPMIQDFVKEHPDLNAIILKEYLDGGGKMNPEELAALTDESDVNVVIVLDQKNFGRNSMKILYAANILNAVFVDGKVGAEAQKLAELAYRRRKRVDARHYYGIDEVFPDYGMLTYDDFREYYQYLIDHTQGINAIDRFLTIMKQLSAKQAAGFINGLPDATVQELAMNAEFFDVLDALRERRIDVVHIKRPKGVQPGLPAVIQNTIAAQFGDPALADPEPSDYDDGDDDLDMDLPHTYNVQHIDKALDKQDAKKELLSRSVSDMSVEQLMAIINATK
jgi:hypothetical protein